MSDCTNLPVNLTNADVCFVVDCTRNMQAYVGELREGIEAIAQAIIAVHPKSHLKFGFVGYTDYDVSEEDRTKVLDFVAEFDMFRSFLATITTDGGGDLPEDVLTGLHTAATQLSWRPGSTHVLIQIGDAPCHGSEFHGLADTYPKGDPGGLTAKEVMKELARLGVFYHFGTLKCATTRKITTNKMIKKFTQLLEAEQGEPIAVFDADTGGGELASSVAQTVRDSITSSVRSVTDTTTGTKRDFEMDKKHPNWSIAENYNRVEWIVTRYKQPTRVNEIQQTSWGLQTETFKQSVLVWKRPFAKGGVRFAFRGRIEATHADVVVKLFQAADARANARKYYLLDLELQTVAGYLADEFNKEFAEKMPDVDVSITFLGGAVLGMQMGPDTACHAFMEDFVDPEREFEFRKFNSNVGAIGGRDRWSMLAQAFSHFTWQFTGTHHMVVDLQGWVDEERKTLLLTDPAIHSRNLLKFGKTNFGTPGFSKFFETHECNPICEGMGLREYEEHTH